MGQQGEGQESRKAWLCRHKVCLFGQRQEFVSSGWPCPLPLSLCSAFDCGVSLHSHKSALLLLPPFLSAQGLLNREGRQRPVQARTSTSLPHMVPPPGPFQSHSSAQGPQELEHRYSAFSWKQESSYPECLIVMAGLGISGIPEKPREGRDRWQRRFQRLLSALCRVKPSC